KFAPVDVLAIEKSHHLEACRHAEPALIAVVMDLPVNDRVQGSMPWAGQAQSRSNRPPAFEHQLRCQKGRTPARIAMNLDHEICIVAPVLDQMIVPPNPVPAEKVVFAPRRTVA